MCRSIQTLYNLEPPATDDEVRAASLQFVRKLSGYRKPSRANEAAFERAVEDIARAASELLEALETAGPARSRELARARALRRVSRKGRPGRPPPRPPPTPSARSPGAT